MIYINFMIMQKQTLTRDLGEVDLLLRKRKFNYYMGDFETTVFKGQEYTEVWASAVVPFYSEDVAVMSSLKETYDYLRSLREDLIIYYHNLKFDGSFWLYFIMHETDLKPAVTMENNDIRTVDFLPQDKMDGGTYTYNISQQGMWYSITICTYSGNIIEIRDSLKLLPFSVKQIGKGFQTKHQKTEIEYEGERHAGGIITKEEREYIANDVLVVKEALEMLFGEGYNKLTIGACCLNEYQKMTSGSDSFIWNDMYPDLTKIKLDTELYGVDDADRYIRLSYHGGWCYVVKGCEGNVYDNGCTVDVNSLYPSVMHSSSGSKYPCGEPTFWKGDYIPDVCKDDNYYYFIRFKCRFHLKKNMLPTVQMKHTYMYSNTEWLETSDILNPKTNKYTQYFRDMDGNIHEAIPTMTMTMVDYKLFREHYDVTDLEILDGCYFLCYPRIFDEYINKYAEIKKTSKGARRMWAKLALNSLYGKMATNRTSSFKYAVMDNDVLKYIDILRFDKKAGFIAVGSAITSYARNFTIRHAQANFYGADKRGFKYADTDSLHLDLPKEELKDIAIHPTEFNHWKVETEWDKAIFTRQKTYIEHVIKEDEEDVEPYNLIKCAGMSDRCKQLISYSLQHLTEEEWKEQQSEIWNDLNETERQFVLKQMNITDFKRGLFVPSKLVARRIKGGTILEDTTYEMR